MDYNPYANYVDLLNSQHESVTSLDSPPVHVARTEGTEDSCFGDTPAEHRERRTWTPTYDIVLISSWLNTSKDPVVGNERKSGAFWKRIAAFFAASPKLAGCERRESMHCKQRWHKINDLVCKRTSGQNENDILKQGHEISFNNYKKKFTLEHAWKELRNDQKWCDLSTAKTARSSKKRKCEDGSQSSTSHATDYKAGETDEGTARPTGVKAAKSRGKKKMEEGKGLTELERMWSIKQEDLTRKERLSKLGLLDRLLAKTEPLAEYEEALKKNLINELFST
ncbi:PREDICTED: glutathione S-transferase T3-like [Brassica oleracea var. oleracea]|uniref:Myb-like domain-containing protein n=1 Tax=Brassica oleracea var. oleracea TaxID=109376 RepID=A0A0D3AD32_BRAOL|nr:PREDICTED: glutathione S-transferase T3-like [Brassica oleracea var. oleracea]